MTKTDRILSMLLSGRNFTAAQLAGLSGASEDGVRGRVSELRAEGYAIYSNKLKNGKQAYRLGNPSREMVKVAHAVAGADLFQ